MSNSLPKPMRHPHPKRRFKLAIATATLLASQSFLAIPGVIAQTLTPGIVIDNQATGSFVDTADGSTRQIESNIVSVTVGEVAGISVTATGTSGTFNPGQIVYFTFTITNEGNDPTQFFIPASANLNGNAIQSSNIEITGYSINGSSLVTLTNPVVIPNGGGQTGRNGTTAGLLTAPNANGEFQIGGYVTVRVPVRINAIANTMDTVTVQLGDTPVEDPASTSIPQARLQNQAFVGGTNDVYTVDNPDALGVTGESAGAPFNGDTMNRRQEASAVSQITITNNRQITGTVFEDPNYGGGAGRPLSTVNTVPRPNATVELYNTTGNYVSSTQTNASGVYTFTGLQAGNYFVRVVNSSVTSSRPGSIATLIPVQTFRTDGSTGSAVSDSSRVGGERPAIADTGAATIGAVLNTSNFTFSTGASTAVAGGQAQSVAPVTVGTGAVGGVDFGFNFDTIVNTNDDGQGSLRQFITNANTLTNLGLAQVGQTAGEEVSIFMIPDGNAHPGLRSGLTNGINGTGGNINAAVINLSSNFSITDSNTHLDATTQTTNVGNLNAGNVGTGGTVGVDGLTLSLIPRPEVVLNLQNVPANTNAIRVFGGNTVLKGFAIYGYRSTGNLATLLKSAIVIDASVPNSGPTTITQLLGGTAADGTDPNVSLIDVGYTLQTAGAANISNNFLAYNSDAITFENTNGTSVSFINNELAYNGPKNNNGSNASGIYADQIETVDGTRNITLRGNLIRNSSKPGYANAQGQGIQISYSSFITLDNNTFTDNNVYGINASSSDTIIQKNIITGTKNTGLGQGSGIIVFYGGPLNTGLRNRITQNSIYQNARLGIDFQADGVTPNNGAVSATQPNNGIDYPIITESSLTGSTLTVRGYVGNVATGSTTFANVTLEFFIADDDGNNNGEVILGDGRSRPHGEGRTYLGTCNADANGLFNCSFANAGTLGLTSATNITATATDANGNTSEFSALPAINNPNVLLVKRITAINGSTASNGGDSLSGYIQEEANPYDDNVLEPTLAPNPPSYPVADTDKWPNTTAKTSSSFLIGGVNGGNTRPGDVVEYTIYFLSTGTTAATNVRFCDRIPSRQTFAPQGFNSVAAAPGGNGSDRGIALSYNGTYASHTNINDGDTAQYIERGVVPLPAVCGGNLNSNPTGAVIINLGQGATGTSGGTIPFATTAPNTDTTTYGFIRFRARVD